MKKKTGLREALALAKSPQEVNDLRVIGSQYDNASDHTKRRWANTARKRLRELAAVLMLFVAVGCAPSGVPKSTKVGSVNTVGVEEISIKGHTYLIHRHVIIHAEHCQCKANE